MHQRQASIYAVAVSRLAGSQSDGGKCRLDWIGWSQVLPMGGREVVERQDPITVGLRVLENMR